MWAYYEFEMSNKDILKDERMNNFNLSSIDIIIKLK